LADFDRPTARFAATFLAGRLLRDALARFFARTARLEGDLRTALDFFAALRAGALRVEGFSTAGSGVAAARAGLAAGLGFAAPRDARSPPAAG
jgi:hypothetical protein